METKVLTFLDNSRGRSIMAHDIDLWTKQGWSVKSQSTSQGKYGVGKTCCLGCLFLPLALLGKKDGTITVILEKPISNQQA